MRQRASNAKASRMHQLWRFPARPPMAPGPVLVCRPAELCYTPSPMDLSVVIPVRNEAPNIAPLVAEIRAALEGRLAYEIVYVDDGSSDGTAAEIAALAKDFPALRIVRHAKSCGQSTAVRSGVKVARAPWIATLDGDGQNDPADIPRLWAMAQSE